MSEDLLSLAALQEDYSSRRQLKRLEIPEKFGAPLAGKVVYYYDVVTLDERQAAMKFAKLGPDGSVAIEEDAVVGGLIARLRNQSGQRLFYDQHRINLMSGCSGSFLRWIWRAIGGVGADTTVDDSIEEAAGN